MDALGQTGQKFAALGLFRRRQNLLVRGVQLAQADIFQQAHVEQELLLGHIGDLVIQRFNAHVPHVLPADLHRTAGHIIKMHQQLG